jgi:hypothetical protein
MQVKSYHETVPLEAAERKVATRRANIQEQGVTILFEKNPTSKVGVSQVWSEGVKRGLWSADTPLTSIRRAVSTLCKRGVLVKTDETRIGSYGKPEFKYKFNKNN